MIPIPIPILIPIPIPYHPIRIPTRYVYRTLQVAFLPLPETKGAPPVTRYKVRVEHDGAAGTGFDHRAVTTAPDTDPSTTSNTADTATGERRVEAAGDGAVAVDTDEDSGFADPTLAQVVLVPARCGLSAHPATLDDTADREQQQQGRPRPRPRRTLVAIRGLKPTTRYRVQVGGSFGLSVGFGTLNEEGEGALALARNTFTCSSRWCIYRWEKTCFEEEGGNPHLTWIELSREYSITAHQDLRRQYHTCLRRMICCRHHCCISFLTPVTNV